MNSSLLIQAAGALPHSMPEEPFGPGVQVWKIGGKIFAVLGGEPVGLTVKCADIETSRLLIEMGKAVKAPYFHASWARFELETAAPEYMLRRIEESYAQVKGGLPKKLRAALDAPCE